MIHIAPFIILCCVSIYGTIGNIFIIGAVCLQKRLRVRGNAFVINLAVADLLITAYIMPIGLATSQYDTNPFGDTMCDVNAFLVMCTCGVSTQSLMLVALERYFHICKTTWYRRLFTTKTTALYIVLIWIYSTIWTAQGWTGWTSYIYGEDVYICIFDGTEDITYSICLAVFGMIVPIGVLIFCYAKIFITVRDSRKAMNTHKVKVSEADKKDPAIVDMMKMQHKRLMREYKLICTLFTIVVFFVVFWSLAALVLVMNGVWTTMPKLFYTISIWLALCNSSVNSIVYGVMNKNFRNGYVQLFLSVCCCCKGKDCKCFSSSVGDTTSASNSKATSPETSVTRNSLSNSVFKRNNKVGDTPPTSPGAVSLADMSSVDGRDRPELGFDLRNTDVLKDTDTDKTEPENCVEPCGELVRARSIKTSKGRPGTPGKTAFSDVSQLMKPKDRPGTPGGAVYYDIAGKEYPIVNGQVLPIPLESEQGTKYNDRSKIMFNEVEFESEF